MNKFKSFVKKHGSFLTCILAAIAAIFGGGIMAGAALGTEGNDPTGTSNPGTEPDKTNDLETPSGENAGQNLDGTQASSSQQTNQDNVDDEWDKELTKFHPFRTPLLSIIRQVSRKVTIKNWTVKHARIGGETLDGRTTAAIAAGAKIELKKTNFNGNLKPFYKGTTIIVPSVAGYKPGSKTVQQYNLVLLVTEADKEKVVCMALNGPAVTEGEMNDDLDCMTCPAIPADTYMCSAATACSESQLTVPPENFQPREEEFQVQKKLFNIVFTEDFEKVKKKVPIYVKDLKADAIDKYNLRAERTYLMGVPHRYTTLTSDGAEELVYTSKGLVWQLPNTYAISGDKIKLSDLIAISKLQHTTFSQSETSYAFCGRNFMEKLLKIDLEDNKRIISFNDVSKLDLDFKEFKTTFGTTLFRYLPAMDACGLEEACLVMDLTNSTRYIKFGGKDFENDMSKGSGEIREARRLGYYEADCVALRGYNGIFVAPDDIAFKLPPSQVQNRVIGSLTLPKNPATGTIVALVADYNDGTTDYEAGNVYKYNGTAWVEYAG